jgi:ERCC4-related helicase
MLKSEMKPHSYIAPDHYITGFAKVYEPMRHVHLQGDQKELYKQMEDELLISLGDTKITAPIALVKYLRLQQISSGVVGDIDGQQHNLIEPNKNPRIQTVLDILENEIDHKVIIACRFKLSIDNLYSVLTKEGYKCAKMIGGMGSKIEEEKAKFNSGDADVLLAQLQVLSFGHTLPGPDENPCDSVIFYENDFSLINRAQCESRPEKYERKNTISYYDMYASKMDKYILTSLIRKEDASLSIMGYAKQYGILYQKDEAEVNDNTSHI